MKNIFSKIVKNYIIRLFLHIIPVQIRTLITTIYKVLNTLIVKACHNWFQPFINMFHQLLVAFKVLFLPANLSYAWTGDNCLMSDQGCMEDDIKLTPKLSQMFLGLTPWSWTYHVTCFGLLSAEFVRFHSQSLLEVPLF